MQLSLLEECRGRVEQALAVLGTVAKPNTRQEMKLLAALGASRLYTSGGVPEVASAWTKALELAKSLGDSEYQTRSLWACGPFMSMVSIIAPLCPWRTGSLPWWRRAPTRTIDLLASG
jgi:hypothetical protein